MSRFLDPQIEMAHGAGGKASRRLIEGLFVPMLIESRVRVRRSGTPRISRSTAPASRSRRTASWSVRCASTADRSASSRSTARSTILRSPAPGPKRLVVTFVLEAGLQTSVLENEVRAMADAARRAGVSIAGGDTKVVEHGKADGMYITTAGVGRVMPDVRIDARDVRPGDRILLSGYIGDHGITILLARGDLDLEADLASDTRSVLPMVEAVVAAAGPGIRWMRDPTRGGVATALNELARDCGLSIHIHEQCVPVRDAVRGACELLGLDPLHIANEGQFLAVVVPELADAALMALRRAPGRR